MSRLSSHLKYGLPFLAFMVGTSYVLSVYLQGKNDIIDDGALVKPSDAYGKPKHAFDLDAELKKMDDKAVWSDDWCAKPVPGSADKKEEE